MPHPIPTPHPVPTPPPAPTPCPPPPTPTTPNGSIAVHGDPFIQNNLTGQNTHFNIADGQTKTFINDADGTKIMGTGVQGTGPSALQAPGMGNWSLNDGAIQYLANPTTIGGTQYQGGDIVVRDGNAYRSLGNINANGTVGQQTINGWTLGTATGLNGQSAERFFARNNEYEFTASAPDKPNGSGWGFTNANIAELNPNAANNAQSDFAAVNQYLNNPTARV
jgi:hypothetical protein